MIRLFFFLLWYAACFMFKSYIEVDMSYNILIHTMSDAMIQMNQKKIPYSSIYIFGTEF